MSFSRCGLQYNRDNRITNDVHNHPRSKQMSCWVIGAAVKPKQSITSVEVIDRQAEDILDIRAEERKLIAEITGEPIKQQTGSGIMDMIGSIDTPRIMEVGKKIMDNASTVSNLFPSASPTSRDIYPGEHHAIIKLPNGKYGRSNYTGPGTRIVDRLRRRGGDPPRVLSDQVSQAHDIRYALANQSVDPEKAVRDADEMYVKKMKALQRTGMDSSVNIQPAMRTIQAKMKAEDWSLLSRDKFINTNQVYSDADNRLLRGKLGELTQQGFGTLVGGNTPGGDVNLHTAKRRPVAGKFSNLPISNNAYFDNQYPKKLGGRLANNRGIYGSSGIKKKVITPQLGEGYPGVNITKIDVPNVVSNVGGLRGSGFPADKLLKKMRKKIKSKSQNARYPIYMAEKAMSSFLANKLAPLIMAH